MENASELRLLIERVLDGALSVREFERLFALRWYQQVSVGEMRSEAFSRFGAVVEKLEFVTDAPSAMQREDGWIDPSDFLAWLRCEQSGRA